MSDAPRFLSESWAEEVVDELLPGDLDWRRLTRTYPTAALGLAAAGGFAVAWGRGPALLAAVSGLVTSRIASNVEAALSEAARPADG